MASTQIDIEILLATMNRDNLDFLKPMFINNNIDDFKLLIVNQTSSDCSLKSEKENIKIINSFEAGSPASRNTAIKNAIGSICLFADDDIIYLPNLKEKLLDAYKDNSKADIITFEAVDENDKRYFKYSDEGRHKDMEFRVNNIGISFLREPIQKTNTLYNRHFGVGSTFPGCTEFVFMKNAWDNGLELYHKEVFIAKHPHLSSGKLQGSDNSITARTALRYRYYKWMSIPWLIKHLLAMVKLDYISFKEIFYKFNVGLKAIKTYRILESKGEV